MADLVERCETGHDIALHHLSRLGRGLRQHYGCCSFQFDPVVSKNSILRPRLRLDRRQYRSPELKRKIVEESLAPGALVARIAGIVDRLRESGEEILDTDLSRVSPLCRALIIPTGTHSFEPAIPEIDMAHNALP